MLTTRRAFTASRPAAARLSTTACCAHKANGGAAAAAAALAAAGLLAATPALAATSNVSFSSGPANGASVSSPVHLEMAVKGMAVRPAADGLIPGTGHFHIDVDTPPIDEGEVIPFDDAHKHYGKGQTAVDLELAPGKHTLTLQFANALHESYGAAFSSRLTLNVQ